MNIIHNQHNNHYDVQPTNRILTEQYLKKNKELKEKIYHFFINYCMHFFYSLFKSILIQTFKYRIILREILRHTTTLTIIDLCEIVYLRLFLKILL